MNTFEYATLEWLWTDDKIRINLPNQQEKKEEGSYTELVDILNVLGGQGWEVITSTSQGNWIFWTLKKS